MKTLCCFLAVLSLLSSLSLAQTGTTSVRGSVTDKTGAAIAGARVSITNTGQVLQRETQTNASGEYSFLGLPPGTYNLSVEKEGFRPFERTSIELPVNVAVTSNVTLDVGSKSEKVEVSAEAATVNTTDASLGNAFSETQVKELPFESRNVPDLLSLQAGVLYTGNNPTIDTSVDTRSGAVNGARSDQSNVSVDGIPANDKGASAFTSVLPVTLDSVQEFRVTTTNYGADQGVSSAAQVSLVTKSGTNSFHGSVYEYNRNSAFSANDFFIKASQIESSNPNKPLQLNRNIFGGSVGGPVVKDRLYFFVNYEGYRDAEAVDSEQIVPTALLRNQGVGYYCLNGDTTLCPGNTAVINGASYTAPPKYMILTPAQITQMDSTSFGPHGPNPVAVQFFNGYPLPNDFTVGDNINVAGYRFRGSTFNKKNWYISKLDYNLTADGRHRLSLSGALANESDAGAPFLPGQAPLETTVNFNKGLIASYTAVLSPSLLNNFHYGFVRQSSGIVGNSDQPWNYLYAISQGVTRSSSFQRPIHNFTDDFSWVKGKHTLQFGVQMAFLRDGESNLNGSFSVGAANPDWMADSGISQSNNPDPLNPLNNGYPGVDSTFTSSYDNAIMTLTGMISLGDAVYNYNRSGTTLAQGAPVTRRFGEDSYEMYAQDSWKVKPNLTLTLGLRYSLFSPPWETNGLQVGTNVNLGDWFNSRWAGMYQGLPSSAQTLVSYNWAGPANGKPGYYGWDTKNFGPRLAFAWSPGFSDGFLGKVFGGPSRSSIRGGFGIVYDRVGESLVDTFDQNGSFGLATQLNNPSAYENSQTAPRLTSMNVIPASDYGNPTTSPATPPQPILEPAPAGGFPQQYPLGLGAISWGIDPNLKTPYSYTMDLAVSRELKSNFTLDLAYVGRISHRLLAQDDLAMPLDIHDQASGLDYFAAEKALAEVFRPQLVGGAKAPTLSFSPSQVSAKVQQFWTDQIQPLVAGGAYTLSGCTGGSSIPTTSPVVFAFDQFCSTSFNDSLALYLLDYYGSQDYNIPSQTYYFAGGQYSYYSPQFSSLYAWRSMAWSNYNALQATLRHRMSHGLQFDLNYTYSKALDISSDAERVGPASNGSFLGLNNNIINAWNPRAQYGPASFDATHQINSNWIYQLPFGRGKMLAPNAGRGLDAAIGGWQLSGVFRWTSGFPVTVDNGVTNFPTNFEMEGNADQIAPAKAGKYFVNGVPNIFANGPSAISSFAPAWAGESGQRNEVRGEGYFGIDLGLAKRWHMPWDDKESLQFRWEVFNVTNTPVFDVQSALTSQTLGLTAAPGTFGNYTGLLNKPRIMQFALRYEF